MKTFSELLEAALVRTIVELIEEEKFTGHKVPKDFTPHGSKRLSNGRTVPDLDAKPVKMPKDKKKGKVWDGRVFDPKWKGEMFDEGEMTESGDPHKFHLTGNAAPTKVNIKTPDECSACEKLQRAAGNYNGTVQCPTCKKNQDDLINRLMGPRKK